MAKPEHGRIEKPQGWRLFSVQQIETLKEFKHDLKRNGKRFNQSTLFTN